MLLGNCGRTPLQDEPCIVLFEEADMLSDSLEWDAHLHDAAILHATCMALHVARANIRTTRTISRERSAISGSFDSLEQDIGKCMRVCIHVSENVLQFPGHRLLILINRTDLVSIDFLF